MINYNDLTTMTTREQVCESLRRLEQIKREIGIKPKLGLVICKGSSNYDFNLWELNRNLIKKR